MVSATVSAYLRPRCASLGTSYAQPLVSSLRFRKPLNTTWTDVKNDEMCLNATATAAISSSRDDCLTIKIMRPSNVFGEDTFRCQRLDLWWKSCSRRCQAPIVVRQVAREASTRPSISTSTKLIKIMSYNEDEAEVLLKTYTAISHYATRSPRQRHFARAHVQMSGGESWRPQPAWARDDVPVYSYRFNVSIVDRRLDALYTKLTYVSDNS